MDTILKDSHGNKIGVIEVRGNCKILKDAHGSLLGKYDGKITRDAHGNKVGSGDLLTMLLCK